MHTNKQKLNSEQTQIKRKKGKKGKERKKENIKNIFCTVMNIRRRTLIKQ